MASIPDAQILPHPSPPHIYQPYLLDEVGTDLVYGRFSHDVKGIEPYREPISADLPLSRPSPFKGEDRWGMVVLGAGDPHPTPPLEGEGDLLQRNIGANQVQG